MKKLWPEKRKEEVPEHKWGVREFDKVLGFNDARSKCRQAVEEALDEELAELCYCFFEKYCPVCKRLGKHKRCPSCHNFAVELSNNIRQHITEKLWGENDEI